MSTGKEESIARLLDQVGWEYHRRGRRAGLSMGEWTLLRHLATADPEVATIKECAYFLAVNRRRISDYVGGLERAGYIQRVRDERLLTNRLEMTAKGGAALRRDPLLRLAGAIADRFEQELLQDLGMTLTALLHAFVDAGLRASAEDRRCGIDDFSDLTMGEAESEDDDIGDDVAVSPDATQEPPKQARAVAILLAETAGDVYKKKYTDKLNRNDWFCLRYFSAVDEEEATIASLTRDTGVNRKIASDSTIALQSMGLIQRKGWRSDREGKSVTVTEKGRRYLAKDPLKQFDAVIAASLDVSERDQLRALLINVLEADAAIVEIR